MFKLLHEVTALVALFSLMWFAMGLIMGRYQPWSGKRRPAARPPRQRGKRSERAKASASGSASGSEELYVGNLSYDISDKDIRKAFEKFGTVASIRLIENRMSGKSKGYAFISMGDAASAAAAIKGMNGKELKGRSIVVNQARTRQR